MVNTTILTSLASKLVAWWRIHVIFSKSLLFVWVLYFTTSFVEFGVVSVIVDYMVDEMNVSLPVAVTLSSFADILVSFLDVFHESRTKFYIGLFNVITSSAGDCVTGLMLFWVFNVSATSPDTRLKFFKPYAMALGILLTVMRKSARKSRIQEFFKYQLQEKLKQQTEKDHGNQDMDSKKKEDRDEFRMGVWTNSAQIAGAGACILLAFIPLEITWTQIFKISSLLMGFGYLIFYSGCFLYSFEKPHDDNEKNPVALMKNMCRVCMAAYRKRKLEYPATVDGYFWKNQRQNHFYSKMPGHVQFLPKAFGFLDKAAIVTETEESDIGLLWSVKEVREVKRALTMVILVFTLLPYGLMKPTVTTFFVLQASYVKGGPDVSRLFVMKYLANISVKSGFWLFKRELQGKNMGKVRILLGMTLSTICCFTASLVAYLPRSSVGLWLFPQFFIFGVAEELVEDGIIELFHNHVPKSMWSLCGMFTELLSVMGNLLVIAFAWGLFYESKDDIDVQLDVYRYYLILAGLNCMFLIISGYYCFSSRGMNEAYPEDGELIITQHAEHANQQE